MQHDQTFVYLNFLLKVDDDCLKFLLISRKSNSLTSFQPKFSSISFAFTFYPQHYFTPLFVYVVYVSTVSMRCSMCNTKTDLRRASTISVAFSESPPESVLSFQCNYRSESFKSKLKTSEGLFKDFRLNKTRLVGWITTEKANGKFCK